METEAEFTEVIAKVGLAAWGLYNTLLVRQASSIVIAEYSALFGTDSRTLRRYLQSLMDAGLIEINDKQVKYVQNAFYARSIYISYTVLINKELKELVPVKKAGTGLMAYWTASYESRYGVKYVSSSWAVDKRNLKLLDARYGERLQSLIDVVMRLYETRWYSQRYPRPTIGAMVSWLAVQADGFVTAETAKPVDSPEPVGEITLDAFDAKFGIGGAVRVGG